LPPSVPKNPPHTGPGAWEAISMPGA
jgi:hypothetical protein